MPGQHGTDRLDTPPQLLDGVAEGGFVMPVCDSARGELGDAASAHRSISDPVRVSGQAAFDLAFADLQRRVAELAPRLSSTR